MAARITCVSCRYHPAVVRVRDASAGLRQQASGRLQLAQLGRNGGACGRAGCAVGGFRLAPRAGRTAPGSGSSARHSRLLPHDRRAASWASGDERRAARRSQGRWDLRSADRAESSVPHGPRVLARGNLPRHGTHRSAMDRWIATPSRRALRAGSGHARGDAQREQPPLFGGHQACSASAACPILCSVPLRSRAMLGRCMTHSSRVSSANNMTVGRSLASHTAPRAPRLARSAASEE